MVRKINLLRHCLLTGDRFALPGFNDGYNGDGDPDEVGRLNYNGQRERAS